MRIKIAEEKDYHSTINPVSKIQHLKPLFIYFLHGCSQSISMIANFEGRKKTY